MLFELGLLCLLDCGDSPGSVWTHKTRGKYDAYQEIRRRDLNGVLCEIVAVKDDDHNYAEVYLPAQQSYLYTYSDRMKPIQ